jgi:molybdopterin converting factor small subunit
MELQFEFASYFSSMMGAREYLVKMDAQEATLGQALGVLLEQYPELENTLRKKNVIINGKFSAMFVVNGNLLQDDAEPIIGNTIRVMAPICGG